MLSDLEQDHPSIARAAASSTDLLPANPLRPPDWRWRRAGQLLEARTKRRRWDDDRVYRARGFLAALAGFGGDDRHPRLARDHPDILGAHRVHLGDPRPRWELEARLLAGQGDGDIADHLGLDVGVIGAYESLFYEVRARLGCTDWVSACLLGAGLYEGFDAGDTETLWKVLAFQGGPAVLDALIANARGEVGPATDPEMAGQLGLLVKATTMPVTPENAPELLRLNAWLRRFDRAEAARDVDVVTGPIVIPTLDVPFGKEMVLLMRVGCTRDAQEGAVPGVEARLVGLSDAG